MHCADAYVEIFYLKCVQLVKLFGVNHFQNLKKPEHVMNYDYDTVFNVCLNLNSVTVLLPQY